MTERAIGFKRVSNLQLANLLNHGHGFQWPEYRIYCSVEWITRCVVK
ncbi:MAG: hypothetical protein JO170_12560 [Verrucomicrobia bacterium]|nr:hypothetical protein [Verrucomicrobiota bacterium]